MPPPIPPPPPSVLNGLSARQALQLGLFAARVLTIAGGAAAAFGLLFIPDPDNVHVEEDVKGIPGLRYSWNRDESSLYLKYDRPGVGQRTVALRINDKNEVIDVDGRIVGRVIGDNKITIDTIAVLPDLVKQDEPKLCPASQLDREGSNRGREYKDDPARQYEDYVKAIINPEGPTPTGYAYYFSRPNGREVTFDDCQQKTGFVFEIKGETYSHLLSRSFGENIERDMLDQSARQLEGSAGRPIIWVFAEEKAADRAQKLFDEKDKGRERITVLYIPWVRSNR